MKEQTAGFWALTPLISGDLSPSHAVLSGSYEPHRIVF